MVIVKRVARQSLVVKTSSDIVLKNKIGLGHFACIGSYVTTNPNQLFEYYKSLNQERFTVQSSGQCTGGNKQTSTF